MDLKALGENLGLELHEFVEIVELFLSTADTDIEKIRRSALGNDMGTAAEAAHSLKGSAGNLGFKEISDIALKAENNASEGKLDGFDDITDTLTEKVQEIKAALKQV